MRQRPSSSNIIEELGNRLIYATILLARARKEKWPPPDNNKKIYTILYNRNRWHYNKIAIMHYKIKKNKKKSIDHLN